MLALVGLILVLIGFGLILLTVLVGSKTFTKLGLYKLWLGSRLVGFGILFPGLLLTALADFLEGYWTGGIIVLLLGPAFLAFWVKLHQADQKRAGAKKLKQTS